jgi:hypothetical protein
LREEMQLFREAMEILRCVYVEEPR